MSVDLPDEILDAIMADLCTCEPDNFWDFAQHKDAKAAWSACSLVCKRWSNIALPHLFRSIRTQISTSHRDKSWLGPLISTRRLQFFTRTPEIARHVQTLYLQGHKMQSHVLDTILQALPSLRRLVLRDVVLEDDVTASPSTTQLHHGGHHIIEELSFDNGEFEPLEYGKTIAHLLSPFTEVGEFTVEDTREVDWHGFSEKNIEAFAAGTTIGHTRVRKLRFDKSACVDETFLFTARYLRRIGALKCLTHLSFHLLYDGDNWRSFFDIVPSFASTLIGICIKISCYAESRVIPFTDATDDDFTVIKRALAACSLLEEIRISVALQIHWNNGYITHPDGKQLCFPFADHEASWLVAIRILGLSPTNRLRRATVGLEGISVDAHILAWDKLKTWCSTAPCLREINVELEQAFDQRPCLAYEMQEFKEIFTPRFILPHSRHINPNRDAILLAAPSVIFRTYRCEHDCCRRYYAGQDAVA